MSVTKNTFKAERSYALLSSDGAQVLQATDKKSERVPHEIQVSLVFQNSGDFYLPFITERLLHSLSIVCRTIDDRSFRQRDWWQIWGNRRPRTCSDRSGGDRRNENLALSKRDEADALLALRCIPRPPSQGPPGLQRRRVSILKIINSLHQTHGSGILFL